MRARMANKPLLCLFLLNQEETRGKDSISPECSARNTGLQGCMSRKQHVFKQLSCMTKGKLMTLAAHTFPVLEEMQISWLGSFPQDGGSMFPQLLKRWEHLDCVMLLPSGGGFLGSRILC